jgi:hypothetical protein
MEFCDLLSDLSGGAVALAFLSARHVKALDGNLDVYSLTMDSFPWLIRGSME